MKKRNKVEKKLSKSTVIDKIKYIVRIIIAIFLHQWVNMKKEIWLFGLADDIYANNGKAFYEFMKEKHLDVELYWVCDEDSINDLIKNIPRENIIIRGSVKNYLYAIDAKVAIYGFSDRDIAPGFFRVIKKHTTILVNVSHGFDGLKGMPSDYYKPIIADIICSASTYEKNMKIDRCGADKEKVKLTGFARYDQWNSSKSSLHEIKNILIIPTWRDWYESENLKWEETELFKTYTDLFNKLNVIAKENEIQIKYNFHPRMKMYFKDAKWNLYSNIFPSEKDETIQDLLNWCDVTITDYSSVFWDSLYMGKPTLLFWFDEKVYIEKRGLLVNNTFYPYIFFSTKDIIEQLVKIINDRTSYKDFSNKYFNWKDNSNCERIYDEIIKLMNYR